MKQIGKVLFIDGTLIKELPKADGDIDSVFIEGYASTNDVDRVGDVVPASVWEAGLKNYLLNPVILSQHQHSNAVGRMVEHKITDKGLWIKARISAAAVEVFNKVKDGLVTAFSVGFRILDAEYNAATELFIVKELELVEISIVSIPCNQNTLFSLSKAFSDADEYQSFKSQFAPKSESAKGLETSKVADGIIKKEWTMTPEEIRALVDEAARNAATEATKAMETAQAAREKAEKDAKDAEAALQARIKDAVALVTPSTTGVEKLVADLTARLEATETANKSAISGLEGVLAEKANEIKAMRESKMTFADGKEKDGSTYTERESAYILSKITGKSLEATNYGKQIREKTGAHLPSATWELEVSLNMEAEVRRRLVVGPNLRNINMKTNVMTMPVNPEAGLANWVTNAQFGTTNSTGGTTATNGSGSPHLLKEITLNAYKVATNEYLAYEEEEDSLLVLMPIVRDAMVRRCARAVDKAFLLGVGSGSDPVKGLASYNATSASAQFVSLAGGAASTNVAAFRAMRKALGALGLDPSEIVFIVSTEVYFNLMEDTTFQTMDKVGDKATILTGQIGSIGGTPVLVSAEFPSAAVGANNATTNIAAVAFNKNNFIVGNQRGLRMDTQDLVETQRKVLVASLRTGMTQIATNLGQGAVTLRYTT